MTDAEFQTAFDQHKDAVYRFAWRMCGSPAAAEDITQDVFAALLRYPHRFDPVRGALRAFLLGIARNLALKHGRVEHRFEPLDDKSMAAELVDLGRGEVGDMVGRAVRALGPLQSEVVILVEPDQIVPAGGTFFEPSGALHTAFGSASPDTPVRALVFLVVPNGSPPTERATAREP